MPDVVMVEAARCIKCGFESPGIREFGVVVDRYPVTATFDQVKAWSAGGAPWQHYVIDGCDGQLQFELSPHPDAALLAHTGSPQGGQDDG